MGKAQTPLPGRLEPGIALVDLQRIAAGGDELDRAVELRARQIRIGGRRANLAIERIGRERGAAGGAQDMLGQHVERAGAMLHGVMIAGRRGVERRAALQHLEAVRRHQHGARGLVEAMVGAAHALDEAARPLRRADIDHEVDVAPVDAEVEGGGAHHGLQRPGGHRGFHLAPPARIEGAVVERDRQAVIVDPPQLLEHQLGLAAGVDEHQRQLVRLDGGVDLGHGIAGGVAGPGQRLLRLQDADLGPRTPVGHDQVGQAGRAIARLGHEIGAQLAGSSDRGGEADTAVPRRQGGEPGEIERQQIAALGRRQRMQLVEDYRLEAGEEAWRVGVRQEQRHLLGRGEQNVGRPGALARLARQGGVAGARFDA